MTSALDGGGVEPVSAKKSKGVIWIAAIDRLEAPD
jgi:hypothetical protein